MFRPPGGFFAFCPSENDTTSASMHGEKTEWIFSTSTFRMKTKIHSTFHPAILVTRPPLLSPHNATPPSHLPGQGRGPGRSPTKQRKQQRIPTYSNAPMGMLPFLLRGALPNPEGHQVPSETWSNPKGPPTPAPCNYLLNEECFRMQ